MIPGWPNAREIRDAYDDIAKRLGNLGLPNDDGTIRALIADEDAGSLRFLGSDDRSRHAADDAEISWSCGVLYGYALAQECTSLDLVERIVAGEM